MRARRFPSFLAKLAACLCALAMLIAPAVAQPAPAPQGGAAPSDPTQEAVRRGVAFLLSQQRPDGSISFNSQYPTAMTGLAIMALTGVGHMPTDPTPEGRAVAAALDYVLGDTRQSAEGYFGQADGSRMYGHGIVTLMLSEVLGMGVSAEQDAQIRRRLEPAIALILRAQERPPETSAFRGGWRYTPDGLDADLSVTVWQVMALRSAAAAGLDVPESAIDAAVAYLERSFRPTDGPAGRPRGEFGYQPGHSFGFSTTAAGLLAMQVCGRYDAPETIAAANWLLDNPPDPDHRWFYYGTYYYAQGMYQAGGEHAETGRHRVESLLVRLQRPEGAWIGRDHARDGVYATSLALLSLSVRYHFMPIYQR